MPYHICKYILNVQELQRYVQDSFTHTAHATQMSDQD